MTKATHTDTKYVILIDFQLQLCFRERASMLRYMCIAPCFVVLLHNFMRLLFIYYVSTNNNTMVTKHHQCPYKRPTTTHNIYDYNSFAHHETLSGAHVEYS